MRCLIFFLLNFILPFPSFALGELQILVFEDTIPVNSFTAELNGRIYTGGGDQALWLSLAEGRYSLKITTEGASGTVQAEVVDQEVTLVLSHIKNQSIHFTLDAPSKKEKTNSSSSQVFSEVKGQVVDQNAQPVFGAKIFVRGLGDEFLSDERGDFSGRLPEGSWQLSFFHEDYSSKNQSFLVKGPSTDLGTVTMAPKAIHLAAYTVAAPRIKGSQVSLLALRKESDSVVDVLGAEQMSRSGDSQAASALSRVTGLTIVDGKYVYVRGLGGRYTSILLNGSQLPSPDPTRRVIPLDLFPTNVLQSIVVQKSYTPDLPGEFGGGTIRLLTKGIPEGFVGSVSLSTSYDADAKARGVTSKSYATDVTSYDQDHRKLPTPLASYAQARRDIDGSLDSGDRERLGESFTTSYQVRERRLEPNLGFKATFGDRFSLLNRPSGYLTSLLYQHEYDHDAYELNRYSLSGGELGDAIKSVQTKAVTRTIRTGGLFGFGVELIPGHEVLYQGLVTRKAQDMVQQKEVITPDDHKRSTLAQWREQELIFHQFRGEHKLSPGFLLGWRYNRSFAEQYIPDRRSVSYLLEGDQWLLGDAASDNGREFRDLRDVATDMRIDLEVPLWQTEAVKAKGKIGYAFLKKDRQANINRYIFTGVNRLSEEIRQKPPEEIFVPENISPTGLSLEDTTLNTDAYRASQRIVARYAMVEMNFWDRVLVVGGARLEDSQQKVETFSLFSPEVTPDVADLSGKDWLPALNVTLKGKEAIQIRLGYSETLSRPDFRELSTAFYVDDEQDIDVKGNSGLTSATIKSYDLRFEWYPKPTRSLSLGLFYKEFSDPIEAIVVLGAGDNIQSYVNSKSAEVRGIEVEALWDLAGMALPEVSFGANVSFLDSRVTLPDDIDQVSFMTHKTRSLQGLSDQIYNLFLSYDHKNWGMVTTLLYNRMGKRISGVGTSGLPDIYEKPRDVLDLVLKKELSETYSLSFKAKNLLNSPETQTQGGKIAFSRPVPKSFSASVTMKL